MVADGEVSAAAVVEQLGALGIETGSVLLVHTSYRAVRPVEGGPGGLIEALRRAIGPDGTLVMPAWSDEDDVPFDPLRSRVAPDLGVVASTFWQLPGVFRSEHPFAFAAAGPAAAQVLADPLPLPPHAPESPVGRVHELDGQVLLLGVNHDANTTIHLAEVLAGVPYRIPKSCTVLRDGRPQRLDYEESDHCCERFALVDKWLRAEGVQREGSVGRGWARLARSQDIVRVARAPLATDPLIILHQRGSGCAECDTAWAHI
jgi:aminoglycoside 3-N-acetyltransferase